MSMCHKLFYPAGLPPKSMRVAGINFAGRRPTYISVGISPSSTTPHCRDAEIRIEMTITPIEDSFALLNRYNLNYSSAQSEQVDGLTYAWRKLQWFASNIQEHLLEIQPSYKADLLTGNGCFELIDISSYSNKYLSRKCYNVYFRKFEISL